MTFAAIMAVIGPILLASLKEFLPSIIGNLLSSIFNPPSPTDLTKNKIDDYLVSGDLKSLGMANSTVIDANHLNDLTKEDLTGMLKLVG